jgi:hypothetical protein
LVVAWHIRDETYSKTLAEFVLHIESALQRTGAKELPSLLMGTVIVLAGAESAAQINARYGSDPSVTFYTHISDCFARFHPKVINAMCAMRRTQNSGQTFARINLRRSSAA